VDHFLPPALSRKHRNNVLCSQVTEILSLDEGRAAYAPVIFDDCFVIHGLRLKISKKGGYFLFMPRRKLADGTYVDIVLPIDHGTRRMTEEKVFAAYQIIASGPKLTAP